MLSFFKQHLYEDLLVDLMAVESWDPSTRQLMYDDEIYDARRVNGSERSILLGKLSQVIKKHTKHFELVSISEDKQTGLISVRSSMITEIAKQWVELWWVG